MNRRTSWILVALSVFVASCQAVQESPQIASEAGILFGPPRAQSEQVMRIETRTFADGDVLTDDGNGIQRMQRMQVERVRSIERETTKARGGYEDRIELRILRDQVRTQLAGPKALAEGTSPGPLAARVLEGIHRSEGWEFELRGGARGHEEAKELKALEAYENRNWFVPRRVRVGDEWPMGTRYLQHILRRDLPRATLVGKARLEEVRAGFARISIRVRGEGERNSPTGAGSFATLELEGELLVDLSDLLDRRLELKGVLETGAHSGRSESRTRLPMEIVVEKSWASGS